MHEERLNLDEADFFPLKQNVNPNHSYTVSDVLNAIHHAHHWRECAKATVFICIKKTHISSSVGDLKIIIPREDC